MDWRKLPWPVLLLLAVGAAGLGWWMSSDNNAAALRAAASDMACPESSLQIVDRPSKYLVEIGGCGQTCTYSVGVGAAKRVGCE